MALWGLPYSLKEEQPLSGVQVTGAADTAHLSPAVLETLERSPSPAPRTVFLFS